jgi:16S rRNA (uracil1498-N3)-methyltransferase
MHRFFLTNTPLDLGASVDLSPLSRQLVRVLRLRFGERVLILDDRGGAATVELREIRREQVFGVVVERHIAPSEPHLRLTLYACILKADKFEWLLQKCTELGVAAFVPVISERTVVRSETSAAKRTRLEAIVREAAEQSGRGRLPALHEPMPLAHVLHASHALRLMPWEEARESLSLVEAVRGAVSTSAATPPETALLIGPEGGFTHSEAAQAKSCGWRIVTLGPRILRAETAALAATAVLMAQSGDLGWQSGSSS